MYVLVVYVVGGALAFSLWFSFFVQGAEASGTLGAKLLAAFAAPVGVILGAFFAANQPSKKIDPIRAWIALIFVIMWNVVVVAALGYARFNFVLLRDMADNVDTVTTGVTFLTAAVLASLFGSSK